MYKMNIARKKRIYIGAFPAGIEIKTQKMDSEIEAMIQAEW